MGTHPIFESDFDCLTEMLVPESGLKSSLSSFNQILKKSYQGKELWDEAEKIFAQVTLHRIPTFPRDQPVRKFATLENDLWNEQTTKCLIVKDIDEDIEETIEQIQNLLKENKIEGINKIIPYNQLKKEYKGYELKRNLAKDFDIFLADNRIGRLALAHLGKEFHRRKKIPFPVDVERPERLAKQIQDYAKTTQVILTSKGANLNIQFGNTLMKEEEKFENLKSLLEKLDEIIPRGIKNIKVISLQGLNTMALPLYRNDEVDPAVEEPSGLELERKAVFDNIHEMREEIMPTKMKKIKNGKRKKMRKSKGKRKLLKIESRNEKSNETEVEPTPAKKAKIESV